MVVKFYIAAACSVISQGIMKVLNLIHSILALLASVGLPKCIKISICRSHVKSRYYLRMVQRHATSYVITYNDYSKSKKFLDNLLNPGSKCLHKKVPKLNIVLQNLSRL